MQEERHEQQEHEGAGRKGGAAAVTVSATGEVAKALSVQERISWTPVWVGFLITIAVQLILGALGVAIALGKYDFSSSEWARTAGSFIGTWSAAVLVVSLFFGALIASRIAGVASWVVHGTALWALVVLCNVVLNSLGMVTALPSVLGAVPSLQGLKIGINDSQTIAELARNGAWYFVVASIVSWLAALWGAAIGASRKGEQG